MIKGFSVLVFSLALISCGGGESGDTATKSPAINDNLVALVKQNNSYQYINPKGEKVIDKTFRAGTIFSEGYACVQDENGWHFIDTAGKAVFPHLTLESPTIFINGKARVTLRNEKGEKEVRYLNTDGTVSDRVYGYATPYQNGIAGVSFLENGISHSGFIDVKEDWYIKYDPNTQSLADYSILSRNVNHGCAEGMVAMRDKNSFSLNPVGFYNNSNEYVIQPSLYEVGLFNEGLCPVSKVTEQREVIWGYINTAGETVIDFKYEQAQNFEDGVAAVKEAGQKWKLIDKQGNKLFEFHTSIHFSEGYAYFGGPEKDKTGFVDKTGTIVIPQKFEWASNFHNGIALINEGYNYGYINKKGEEVLAPVYNEASYFYDPNETNLNDKR